MAGTWEEVSLNRKSATGKGKTQTKGYKARPCYVSTSEYVLLLFFSLVGYMRRCEDSGPFCARMVLASCTVEKMKSSKNKCLTRREEKIRDMNVRMPRGKRKHGA